MEGFATESTSGPFETATSANKNLNEKLAEIVHHAEMMTGASGAAIALREGDWLETRASTGTTAPDVGSRSRIRGSFTGLVIETGEAVRCDDSDNDHRVDPAICRSLQTRSIVVVPVRVDTTVTGVLAVFASSPHSFSNVHVSAIKTLAEIAGEIIAKFRPAAESKSAAEVEPHLQINRVSLEEPPGLVPEEVPFEAIADDVQAILTESEMPVAAALVEEENIVVTEAVIGPGSFSKDMVNEPVIGPGSFSQRPSIVTGPAETPRTAEIIELRPPKLEPEERKPEPRLKITEVAKPEPPKQEAALVLAMAAAPPPPKRTKQVTAERDDQKRQSAPISSATKEQLLTLADDLAAAPKKPTTNSYASADLASWDLKPERNFSFFKVAVPVGLAAALALTVWLYVTKWRGGAANPSGTPATQVQPPPAVDPITAAAHAQETPPASTGSSSTAALQQASMNTAPAAQKPPEMSNPEELEPEVVTNGPKPLVVQNAGAATPTRRLQPVRAEAPQVIASAGALPLPSLELNGGMPKLQAKQSSLVPNQLMKSVAPVYPEAARRLGTVGAVMVEAQINANGAVTGVRVLDGEPLLARAAVAAVKQWKYRPSYLNGEPVASTAKVTLNFKPQKE